jgi:Ca2+-binding RTX toxin-like protein
MAFEIDRSTGTFNVSFYYTVYSYMDPATLEWFEDNTWNMSYSRSGGPLLGLWSGWSDTNSGQAFADFGLETGPGLKTYVIDFSATNRGGYGEAASWNVFSVAYDTTPQMVAGTVADDVIIGGGASDELRGFDGADLIDAGDGNDFVEGGAGFDQLDGGAGDDILIGGASYDWLVGGVGDDILFGGAGDDFIAVDSPGDIPIEFADEGHDQVASQISFTLVDNVEELSLVGIGNLNGTGNAANNRIWGNSGANTLSGLDGHDVLMGFSGDDVLRGGAGADQLEGRDGNDTASYYTGTTGVVVNLTIVVYHGNGTGSGGEAAGDILMDIENVSGSQGDDSLIGDNGANTLQGWYGNDALTGHGGNDVLDGGGGNDVLYGYVGADALDGGAGSDTASYYTGTTGIVVNLATGFGSGGQAAGDTLTEIETLSGSQGNDSLIGDGGANTLQGWNGDDMLTGASGKDTLVGGAGADRFAYTASGDSAVGANADRITDFSHAQGDKIDLAAIDADTGAAGDQAFSFIGTALYTGVAGQLRYVSNGTITTIAGDLNGDGTSDFHIQLTGAIALVAGDFTL